MAITKLLHNELLDNVLRWSLFYYMMSDEEFGDNTISKHAASITI